MPNLVKKSHLQDVLLDIWNKIQDKLNGHVHKTKENVIAGKTVLLDGYIPGVSVFDLNNTRANGIMSSNTCLFVCEDMRVSANQKVCQITIGIESNKQIGDKITGVNIGAIKASNGQVLDYVIQNGVAYIHKNIDSRLGCDKAITINIDKTWTEDVRLMVGANGALWGQRSNNYGGNAKGMTSLPNVGDTVTLEVGGNYIGKAIAYGDDLALRDLGNSSTNMVTKDEFNAHKGDVAQTHQTLQTNISSVSANLSNLSTRVDTASQNISNLSSQVNSANSNISSQGQRISSLESGTAKLGSPNRFTSKNVFIGRSPIVDKYYSIKNIDGNKSLSLYTERNFCCNPKEGITRNGVNISAILLPIHSSKPGDTIQASFFIFDAGNGRLTSNMTGLSTYTVQDIEYKGHHCIVFEVNQVFNYAVGFGFKVEDRVTSDSRRIGMIKQDNSGSGSWSTYHPLSSGQIVGGSSGNSGNFTIPYAITQKEQSEVVTRFDLANTTFPIDTAQVGELKFMAYDMGENYEANGHVWVKCEGQAISTGYPELLNLAKSEKLPSNNSPVGYTYICVK